MNEAMPQWRSFGTSAPSPPGGRTPPPGDGEGPAPAPGRPWWRWLAPALAAIGGLLAGGAMAVAAFLVLIPPASAIDAGPGEPLVLLPAASSTTAISEAPRTIVVDVAGAVARPGLHRLDPGGRVGDAIAAAGGFAPRADLEAAGLTLNLAQPLEDGAKVLVPALGSERRTAPSRPADGRIDLNRAGQAELESLPGIGPVTAGKIIAARAEQRFGAVRDLRTRGLVGESVYADIKDRLFAG